MNWSPSLRALRSSCAKNSSWPLLRCSYYLHVIYCLIPTEFELWLAELLDLPSEATDVGAVACPCFVLVLSCLCRDVNKGYTYGVSPDFLFFIIAISAWTSLSHFLYLSLQIILNSIIYFKFKASLLKMNTLDKWKSKIKQVNIQGKFNQMIAPKTDSNPYLQENA